MKESTLLSRALAALFALAVFFGANDASAANRVRITAKNSSTIRKVGGLERYGVKAACMIKREKPVAGAIYKRRFFVPLRKVSRRRGERKAYRRAVAKLRKTCRNLAGGNTSGPLPIGSPPAVSPAPQPPASNPPAAKPPASRTPASQPPASQPPASPPPANRTPANVPAIPSLAQWESEMKSFGAMHCANMKSGSRSYDQKLAATYYDAEWVFYQIADYTRDSSWNSCAQAAEAVYRDRYVVGAGGRVPGYWNFSHGLLQDWLRTGDEASRAAVRSLSRDAAYAPDTTPLEWTQTAEFSREVAYAIMAYLNAEDVGEARRARLGAFVNQALGHFDQWFVTKNAPYVRPFMAGLTAHALISYHEKTGDPRIIPALRTALDWLWDNTWLPSAGAFKYTDRVHSSGGMEPAPDLNMLIAPAYAYLWRQTGEDRFRDRGDQIFAGGVRGAFLNNGKQYNQNYRWSFEFVKWRSQPPLR